MGGLDKLVTKGPQIPPALIIGQELDEVGSARVGSLSESVRGAIAAITRNFGLVNGVIIFRSIGIGEGLDIDLGKASVSGYHKTNRNAFN